MKALILAAGQGIRLGSYTQGLPKGLVTVAGRPLILHTLDFLNTPPITKVGCVIGFQAETVRSFLQQQAPAVAIFENQQFRAGNLLSLMAGFSFLDEDCLLLNVDHIYPKHFLERVLARRDSMTIACDFDRKLIADDMKVALHQKQTLVAIDKQLTRYDGGYIGMTYLPKGALPRYREACQETLQQRGEKACVEAVLDTLAKQGERIAIADLSGSRWHEVDTEEDAKSAQQKLA